MGMSENCSWEQHDDCWSDVCCICHDKKEINSLSRAWLRLCINIPCVHCCSFPLFPKQTSGNLQTCEVRVCQCLFLMVVLFSFARVGHTSHFLRHLTSQMSFKILQYRDWSGPCSLSLRLVLYVLSQPRVWCHFSTRLHLKYWFISQLWVEGPKSCRIHWRAKTHSVSFSAAL